MVKQNVLKHGSKFLFVIYSVEAIETKAMARRKMAYLASACLSCKHEDCSPDVYAYTTYEFHIESCTYQPSRHQDKKMFLPFCARAWYIGTTVLQSNVNVHI